MLCRGFLGRVCQGFSHIGHRVSGTAGRIGKASKQRHYQLAAAGIAVTLAGSSASSGRKVHLLHRVLCPASTLRVVTQLSCGEQGTTLYLLTLVSNLLTLYRSNSAFVCHNETMIGYVKAGQKRGWG